MKKETLIQVTRAAHKKAFDHPPVTEAWAPGRTEILGNHTDYNAGTVLSAAVDLGIHFTLSPSNRPGIRLQAVDAGHQIAQFRASDTDKVPSTDWANYVKGVFHYLETEVSQSLDGLDCSFAGSIPMGAGLSSSAALEVASALSLIHISEPTDQRGSRMPSSA